MGDPKEGGVMRMISMTSLLILLSPTLGITAAASTASTEETFSSALSGSATSSESRRTTAGSPIDHDLFVEIIQIAYELLEAYAAGPVTSLSFTLSNFETVPRERFDEIPYRELLTFPEGRLVQVTHSQVKLAGSEVRHVRYIPRWTTEETFIADLPEGPRMLTASVAEALEEISTTPPEKGGTPEYAEIFALTRYDVTVRLDDEERQYAAAFYWRPSSDVDSWTFHVSDHVVGGVAEVTVEDLPTALQARGLRKAEAQSSARGSLGGASSEDPASSNSSFETECVPRSSEFSESLGLSGFHGHFSGSHSSNADFSAGCSCQQSCLNKCLPEFDGSPTCVDTGIRDKCHKLAFAHGLDGSSTEMGVSSSPNCAFGYGCVYKGCLFCECNLGVSVSANAGVGSASVNFSNSGDPQETMNVSWTHECALCTEAAGGSEDPPHQEDETPCPCTPIVIDLLGDGFRFTSGPGGVDFDILDEGHPIRVAWTASEGDDVFLVRDVSSDEFITDGGELFGNETFQPKTDEPNGYNALGRFDTPARGGNGDGRIDARDRDYTDLWVWHDRDHDGVSAWEELYSLEQAGIDTIYLDYWRSDKEQDEHGNELRYFGRVCLSSRESALANRLIPDRAPGAAETNVLDPMKRRVDADPEALAGTECEGRIVQSTDVYFVVG